MKKLKGYDATHKVYLTIHNNEVIKPGSPHTLGQWEKYFVSKKENNKKTA